MNQADELEDGGVGSLPKGDQESEAGSAFSKQVQSAGSLFPPLANGNDAKIKKRARTFTNKSSIIKGAF
jgi:hypothetical protein